MKRLLCVFNPSRARLTASDLAFAIAAGRRIENASNRLVVVRGSKQQCRCLLGSAGVQREIGSKRRMHGCGLRKSKPADRPRETLNFAERAGALGTRGERGAERSYDDESQRRRNQQPFLF